MKLIEFGFHYAYKLSSFESSIFQIPVSQLYRYLNLLIMRK